MEKLTAIIPTYNEEHNMAAAIASVHFADEVLVVDSYSTDKTVAIAREAGARVIQHEYENSASQKNWAIPQAIHPWYCFAGCR
ncbi:MAG: glycosyltransferase [Owenweeksia sp.]|nr:glycosyltransferase [Owenweeksia sp.]